MGQVSIMDIQRKIESMAQVDCPVDHKFVEGLYCRTIYIPPGSLVIGKRHKKETLNILLQGRISVFNGEDGSDIIEAPHVFVSKANTKKIGYAHTPVLFANIHATEKDTPEEVEKEVIVPDDEYQGELEYMDLEIKTIEGD